MQQINLHRNSQKRFVEKDFVYFITTVTQGRFPFFQEDVFCDLFIENLKLCKKLKKFKLFGFVVLLDHVHLLIQPGDEFNISKVMFSIKKQFSHDVNRVIGYNDFYSLKNEGSKNEGGQTFARLQDDDILNYQENIKKLGNNQYFEKYFDRFCDMIPFKWQESFHDHVIRSEEDFFNHLNYIYFNCVKHNICADPGKYRWLFSNREFACFIDGYFD